MGHNAAPCGAPHGVDPLITYKHLITWHVHLSDRTKMKRKQGGIVFRETMDIRGDVLISALQVHRAGRHTWSTSFIGNNNDFQINDATSRGQKILFILCRRMSRSAFESARPRFDDARHRKLPPAGFRCHAATLMESWSRVMFSKSSTAVMVMTLGCFEFELRIQAKKVMTPIKNWCKVTVKSKKLRLSACNHLSRFLHGSEHNQLCPVTTTVYVLLRRPYKRLFLLMLTYHSTTYIVIN